MTAPRSINARSGVVVTGIGPIERAIAVDGDPVDWWHDDVRLAGIAAVRSTVTSIAPRADSRRTCAALRRCGATPRSDAAYRRHAASTDCVASDVGATGDAIHRRARCVRASPLRTRRWQHPIGESVLVGLRPGDEIPNCVAARM